MRKLHFFAKISCVLLLFTICSCNTSISRIPAITVDPTTNDFGVVNIGSSSTPFTFTIANVGTGTLKVSSIDLTGANSGDFSFDATLPMNIRAGSDLSFTVTFTPTVQGARSAELSITHNVVGSPTSYSLSGTGIMFMKTIISRSIM